MQIFCINDFKKEYETLIKKRSYKPLEEAIISYFHNKKPNDLKLKGARLNQSHDAPFIKQRLNGSGGFRIYFLLLVKENKVYLAFVHPKTGSKGAESITDKSKGLLQKRLYDAIKTNNLFRITLNKKQNSIKFTMLSPFVVKTV